MSRRIRLTTVEYGELRLELVFETADGEWDPEWELLRGTVFGEQFTVISREVLDHALKGWMQPLVKELGIPPYGALRKIPVVSRQCARRTVCSLHIPSLCSLESKNMPWCFEPDGVVPEAVRKQAARAIEIWRDQVYLIVVRG